MTTEEKWCRKLEKLLRAMPETLECTVCSGTVDIYNAGTEALALRTDGDTDRMDQLAEFHHCIIGVRFSGSEERI